MTSFREDALQVLPLELWVHMAMSGTPGVWLNLCRAVAPLGSWSLDPDVQLKMMDKFVRESNGTYRLPNGALHSYHDRPAEKWYWPLRIPPPDGTFSSEKWYQDLKAGPAEKGYWPDGILECEKWFQKGKLHRGDDQPAGKEYYKDGPLKFEAWYQHGKHHRDGDQPAEKKYYKDGTLESEFWYQHGKFHREGDQPARKWYTKTVLFQVRN